MAVAQVESTSETSVLDEFDVLHRRQRETEVQLLVTAVAWAEQNGVETVDPVLARLPGRQRAVQVGGPGTPKVGEFAGSMMGARLELSAYAGEALLGDALDLRYRLPLLWERVQRLEVRAGHARFVARKTRQLTAEQSAYVDRRVVQCADGRLSWARFESLVEASVTAADPEAARAREQEAAERRFAKATRSDEHGMRGFYVRADFATIARIDATVAFLAEALLALGVDEDLDHRRVLAVLIMANPPQAMRLLKAYAAHNRGGSADPQAAAEPDFKLDESKLLPTICLYVHLALHPDGRPGDVARAEGQSPVTARWVGEHLGPRCSFRITPVLDPLDQVPVDAYEIPLRHRQAVHILTPADIFPYASNTSRSMQIDHTIPWRPGVAGQSRVGNYGPMTTFHHRLKTHGDWEVRQPFPGVYVWRDGHGATYVVDNTGTRRVNQAA